MKAKRARLPRAACTTWPQPISAGNSTKWCTDAPVSPGVELSTCFTYGSLMWPDIMARVCGREVLALQHTQAWLLGHVRHPVRGQDYPGLVPQSGAQALQGVLYTGLTPQDLQRLDTFEGQEYERVPVEVVLENPATTDGLAPA
ncbi:MAG: gamma-glutamylcyclotransferase family protein, partial [Betaproteobacteria bacterium]